jgi:hypothetical protein
MHRSSISGSWQDDSSHDEEPLPYDDLLNDDFSSDDDFPDLVAAFGLNKPSLREDIYNASSRDARKPSNLSQENVSPKNSFPAGRSSTDALTRVGQLLQETSSSTTRQRRTSKASSNSRGNVTSNELVVIDLDPISSSSPFRSIPAPKPSFTRTQSLNLPSTSREAAAFRATTREPLSRASSFHNADTTSRRTAGTLDRAPIYEISDDDDPDIRAAIAASLADMEKSNSPIVPPTPSAAPSARPLQYSRSESPKTLDLTHSSPSPSQTQTDRRQSQRSSQASMPITDDTRRNVLAILDNFTRTVMKRKSEELDDDDVMVISPPKGKAAGKTHTTSRGTADKVARNTRTENIDQDTGPKPRKRNALSQQEKVIR